jgi:hypothetical protein
MAALSGGGGMASQDMMAEGPAEGMDAEEADEESGERDALSLIREAIALLREAGTIEEDDMRSHMIDKTQADLQKILSSEAQKTSKLRSALGG